MFMHRCKVFVKKTEEKRRAGGKKNLRSKVKRHRHATKIINNTKKTGETLLQTPPACWVFSGLHRERSAKFIPWGKPQPRVSGRKTVATDVLQPGKQKLAAHFTGSAWVGGHGFHGVEQGEEEKRYRWGDGVKPATNAGAKSGGEKGGIKEYNIGILVQNSGNAGVAQEGVSKKAAGNLEKHRKRQCVIKV